MEEGTNRIRVKLLGGFAMQWQGRDVAVSRNAAPRFLQLLELVWLHGGEGISREQLLLDLYGCRELANASNSINNLLLQARKHLADAGLPKGYYIVRRGHRYVPDPAFEVDCDAERLRGIMVRGRAASGEEREDLYQEVFGLYQGRLLPELTNCSWAEREAGYLTRDYAEAVSFLVQRAMARGDADAADRLVRAAGQIEPGLTVVRNARTGAFGILAPQRENTAQPDKPGLAAGQSPAGEPVRPISGEGADGHRSADSDAFRRERNRSPQNEPGAEGSAHPETAFKTAGGSDRACSADQSTAEGGAKALSGSEQKTPDLPYSPGGEKMPYLPLSAGSKGTQDVPVSIEEALQVNYSSVLLTSEVCSCTWQSFCDVVRVIGSNMERTRVSACLVQLNLVDYKGAVIANADKRAACMRVLRTCIEDNLRRGDACARCGDSGYALLLMGYTAQERARALRHIRTQLRRSEGTRARFTSRGIPLAELAPGTLKTPSKTPGAEEIRERG